jgi:hypothetical protein
MLSVTELRFETIGMSQIAHIDRWSVTALGRERTFAVATAAASAIGHERSALAKGIGCEHQRMAVAAMGRGRSIDVVSSSGQGRILFCRQMVRAFQLLVMPRSTAISLLGGAPNRRLYSRLNCDGLSYPTLKAALAASNCSFNMSRLASFNRSHF